MSLDDLFLSTDTDEFRENVLTLLRQNAHRLRSIEAPKYVDRCRQVWQKTKANKLYSTKLLVDGVISGKSDRLHCITIALIHVETDITGTNWRSPPGYASKRKPLTDDRDEIIFVYPTGALSQEPELPEPSTQLVALFDVLGFEDQLKRIGLKAMHVKYRKIINHAFLGSIASDKFSRARGMMAGELRNGYLKLPIRYAYFSDTLLIWTTLHNAFIGTFLDRCSSLICSALTLDVPLRGAIAVGEVILHKKSNTYLGEPLVEAARLEAAQDSIGVALGPSVRTISFPPDRVQRYAQPVKHGREHLLSGLVLDWPRHWRSFYDVPLSEKLESIRAEGYEKYYDSAVLFARFSEANPMWFAAELESIIGKFSLPGEA